MNRRSSFVAASVHRQVRALAELWSILRAGKWWILATTAAVTALAVALAYILPVKYRAETLLQPARSDRDLGGAFSLPGGLASLAGLTLGLDDRSAEARAVLESKAFTMEFVRAQNLLPVLFEDLWDEKAGRWRTDDSDRIPTELDAYRMFRDQIRTVSQDSQTRMVLLAIEWTDAELAAKWANDMVVLLNEKMRSDAIERSRRNMEFLRKEYENTTVTPVREAIARLMESELQTAMLASVQPDYAFRVIDPAVVPNRRISPNRRLIAATGLVVGLALGVLIALVRVRPAELPDDGP
ncbi:MAG TPA: Wzz/FepE/Etk N-terminal domain-containing protein [Gammaproteobacteria bacterium]